MNSIILGMELVFRLGNLSFYACSQLQILPSYPVETKYQLDNTWKVPGYDQLDICDGISHVSSKSSKRP